MHNKEIHLLEKKFISKIDRFALSHNELNELKKNFSKANILIVGAAGSIGSVFVSNLKKFNFSNLHLIDKDENRLTELSRNLNITFNKEKIKKINYYCVDICAFDINNEILNKKITHYLNFAAVKHVRSEENILSIQYMVKTNSINFIKKKFIKKNNLKKVFSISTDKSANPSSILGITKKLMEQRLFNFKSNNHKIFVSSVRFANVSFSNGSILKYIIDRINRKITFGIPSNINRYFITHSEASSLCFKSLLKKNDGCILIPSYKVLGNLMNIKKLCEKILNFKGYKAFYTTKNIRLKGKKFPVVLNKKLNHGQKLFEELHEKNEIIFKDNKNENLYKVKLPNSKNFSRVVDILINEKNKRFMLYKLKKFYPNVYTGNKRKMVSKII